MQITYMQKEFSRKMHLKIYHLDSVKFLSVPGFFVSGFKKDRSKTRTIN